VAANRPVPSNADKTKEWRMTLPLVITSVLTMSRRPVLGRGGSLTSNHAFQQ
jgi:hypothetical protein